LIVVFRGREGRDFVDVLCQPRYLRDGETRVVILDRWSVAHARMRAAGLEPGVYVSGCRIDGATAVHIPVGAVGRVLTRQEALALLVPKKPPASSLSRRFH
jgi:hypothetical protein